ncbi:MAG: hypothetical protein NTX15_08115, partial [Candidatus Kapabacteria bacterium]|nr:hypothetical protein [Candidatus Kapabacteria bacterium]
MITTTSVLCQLPKEWKSRGIGGGGAMFALSINPNNPSEFYAGCDMSNLFHSADGGRSYNVLSYRDVNGGHNSSVRFTSVPGLLYVVSYKLNGNVDQVAPAKSTDGGNTWQALPGVSDPSEETYSLYVDYYFPNRVMMSTYSTVYWSSDGGSTFAAIHQAADNGSGVVVGGALLSGDTVIVGTNDGLITSTNAGATFTLSTPAGIVAGEKIFSFAAGWSNGAINAVCITAKSNVFVGLQPWEYNGQADNVYTMSGWGSPFVRRDAFVDGREFPMMVAMSVQNARAMYIGGSSSAAPMVKKSTDGGLTWKSV